MYRQIALGLLIIATQALTYAQSTPNQIEQILAKPVQTPGVVEYQLKLYLESRVPKLPTPVSAREWAVQAEAIRKHVLNGVIFHGWPADWIRAPLKSEEAGSALTGRGYRMRKLRLEVVPGFWTTAILYEPANLSGKAPAILNLNGHGAPGKAVEYQQKRCINYSLQGIVALNLEWIGFGDLAQPGNGHDFGAQLDLAGANAVGLHYLAMRKGLDYLDQDPDVDRSRIGVTGLSGGGWQTIVLSALDSRVAVAVPVAGYGSLASNIVHPKDTSQIEEDGADLRAGQDYTHLTAMRAPRPTLLIYNAEDTCCFRAPVVKDGLYGGAQPFFALFGRPDALAWHENLDPGTHNYQLDNRLQSYRFFAMHFHLPVPDHEVPVDAEIRSPEELSVSLPPGNLTVLDLARRFAADISRSSMPASEARNNLRSVVRYRPVAVRRSWMVDNTKNNEVESRSYEIGFSDGLSASAVWMKANAAPDDAPLTVLLDDKGKQALAAEVSERVNRGERAVALDLLFTGDSRPMKPSPADYALLLASTGSRPIGMESAQLIAATHWLLRGTQSQHAQLETSGMRSQLVALIAASLEPSLFSELAVRDGISSLAMVFDAPIHYRTAPDLFCLDLYKQFDLGTLKKLAAPGTRFPR